MSEKVGNDLKRRKTTNTQRRACDACRRKKIRCYGVDLSINRCRNCIDYGLACTYDYATRGQAPPKPRSQMSSSRSVLQNNESNHSYVENLESRVERLQDLLAKVSPEALEHLDTFADDALPSPTASSSSKPDHRLTLHNPAPTYTAPPSTLKDNVEGLTDHLGKLCIQPFFGKSSAPMLVKTALELKREYLEGKEGTGESGKKHDSGLSDVWPPTKLTFPSPEPPQYTFPPPDLLASLIDLYFLHMNRYVPLLHRPTFQRAVAHGLHHMDSAFAATVLLVCAVAARYSDDPRVMDDPVDPAWSNNNEDWENQIAYSCGWKWCEQVQMINIPPLVRTCLYELQFYALLGQFLQGSCIPEAGWSVVGIGIRVAQDFGAHRRKACGVHTVEDELWKRVFWVLVCMDSQFSVCHGRPLSIHNEDFDLDMPIECDDEYWERPDPQLCWRQPTPNKTPSVVTYFNAFIRLNRILAFSIRKVYAINKSKILLGFMGQQREESIVSELDSALNAWLDNIPDHLRWDPKRVNDVWFKQSASLYCAYYHTRILVHRPFIPSPHKPDVAHSFPSLAICTNAARACSCVLEAHGKRFKITPPQLQATAFSVAVVLLVNIWGGKRSGLSTDFNKDLMADVQKCTDVIQASEPRWYLAGRFNHILCELVSVGDLPFPRQASDVPTTAQKRGGLPQQEECDHPATLHASHWKPSVHPLHGAPDAMDSRRGIVQRQQGPAPAASGSGSGSLFPTQPSSRPQEPLSILPKCDHGPNPVYQQQHQHHPAPQRRRRHTLHGIVNPQDWYGATSVAQFPQFMPQTHPQGSQHIPPLPSVVPSSTGSGSAYYAQPTAASEVGLMSSFAPQGEAEYRVEDVFPYWMSQEPGSGVDIGAGVAGGAEAGGGGLGAGMGMATATAIGFDDDAFAMWSDVPAGFELTEWGDFLSGFSDATAAQHGQFHGASGGSVYPATGQA